MASVNAAFTPVVTFTNVALTLYASDSLLYETDYSVFITPTMYAGHVRFSILPDKNAGTWVIARWEDVQTSNTPTLSWSDLKGQFSQ